MYIDQAQINRYEKHLEQAAHEFQDAQYDATQVRQWLGRISAWVGERLVLWGQHIQAKAPTAALKPGR